MTRKIVCRISELYSQKELKELKLSPTVSGSFQQSVSIEFCHYMVYCLIEILLNKFRVMLFFQDHSLKLWIYFNLKIIIMYSCFPQVLIIIIT